MKIVALATALLIGGAAFAQVDVTAGSTAYEGDGSVTTAFETEGAAFAAPLPDTLAGNAAAGAGFLVQPSNANPERDARGIAVISAAALVPAGWNGTPAGEALGGPELDPVTGAPVAASSYPACTRAVTDRCVQTYE